MKNLLIHLSLLIALVVIIMLITTTAATAASADRINSTGPGVFDSHRVYESNLMGRNLSRGAHYLRT
jgi:hypothetical protein